MTRATAVVVLLAMCCAGAFASVGLEPASGYIHLPDAQVVKTGSIEGFAGYISTHGTNELGRIIRVPVPCDGNGFTLGAVGGLGKTAELGVGYMSIDKSVGTAAALAVAAKWQFVPCTKSGVSAALGAQYRKWNSNMSILVGGPGPFFDFDLDLPTVTSVYLAVDKASRPRAASLCRVSGTVGVIYNHYGNIDLPFSTPIDMSKNFISPFIGATVGAARWGVLSEFRPRLETDGFSYHSVLWSLAVRAQISESTSATAGVSTFNLPYTRSTPAFFFELTHRFGR